MICITLSDHLKGPATSLIIRILLGKNTLDLTFNYVFLLLVASLISCFNVFQNTKFLYFSDETSLSANFVKQIKSRKCLILT